MVDECRIADDVVELVVELVVITCRRGTHFWVHSMLIAAVVFLHIRVQPPKIVHANWIACLRDFAIHVLEITGPV